MDEVKQTSLHVVSWNVASWLTTLNKIKRRHKSLNEWILKHNIDILCIQEVKIAASEICYHAKDVGATGLPGFESFWACPVVSGSTSGKSSKTGIQGGGLNGVATFARTGFTIRATAKALNDPQLDGEGRCLLTDHGTFVIFNVYVPNSGQSCKRYPFKIRFLRALESAIVNEKRKGKRVIIVGDYNLAPRACDVTREYRFLDMTSITKLDHDCLTLVDSSGKIYCETLGRYLMSEEFSMLRDGVIYLQSLWPDIERSLRAGVDVVKEGEKHRLVATRISDGKQVRIGKASTVPISNPFALDGIVVEDASGESFCVSDKGCVHVCDLRDAYKALAPSGDPGLILRQWDVLADVLGLPCHGKDSINWFYALKESLNLVDTFATAHPTTRGFRYTCWDQSSNRRYSNEGSRIDIILVEEEMWRRCGCPGQELVGLKRCLASSIRLEKAQSDLFCGCGYNCSLRRIASCPDLTEIDGCPSTCLAQFPAQNSEAGEETETVSCYTWSNDEECRAALWAATAGGQFAPAAVTGGGIPEASSQACQVQFQNPQTGIIYTPPEFSDHVAVSLWLHIPKTSDAETLCSCIVTEALVGNVNELELGSMVLSLDADTKLTQPFRQQSSITSLFQKQRELQVSKPVAVAARIEAPTIVNENPMAIPTNDCDGKSKVLSSQTSKPVRTADGAGLISNFFKKKKADP